MKTTTTEKSIDVGYSCAHMMEPYKVHEERCNSDTSVKQSVFIHCEQCMPKRLSLEQVPRGVSLGGKETNFTV